MQKTITIFLASSEELAQERKDFEYFIYQRCKALGVLIEVIAWENTISNSMSKTRLQDKYNEIIPSCDMFVGLFYTKVGKWTEEEFDIAWKSFHKSDKPKLFTYFKKVKKQDKQDSLQEFLNKLSGLGHFPTVYKNTEDLHLQLRDELERYFNEVEVEVETDKTVVQNADKIYNIGKIDKAEFK
ncbi:hypothetical protein QUF74_06715 [Candidatus Halobeggiatoa sp. HSG11]|nr:hypothetical protein [Candidatus Halobeggiatoa sp. HSG11]